MATKVSISGTDTESSPGEQSWLVEYPRPQAAFYGTSERYPIAVTVGRGQTIPTAFSLEEAFALSNALVAAIAAAEADGAE
jgi:hypothetical protein